MNKGTGVLWIALMSCSVAFAVTQEELAQYVARQQTVGISTVGGGLTTRRQAYTLQPQAKSAYQAQPQEQIYQIAKQPAYQPVATKQVFPAPQQQYYQPQPQPQQYYQPQPAKKLLRPTPGQQLQEENPEDYDPNPQYQFGFDIKDDQFTNYQQRKEQREGNKISGSYSVVDADGYIRTVTYTADPLEGFKADVVRQPTDIKIKFPVPQVQPSSLPDGYQNQYISQAARKQQTQQYLQASKPQLVVRPEHTQAYTGSQSQLQYRAAPEYSSQPASKPSGLAYSQQPLFSNYQQ